MGDESRAYPSPEFFEDRLRIEVEKAYTTVKSLDEALAQLRVIWGVKNREAVLAFIENLRPRRQFALPEDVQPEVAGALKDLVDATNGLPSGHRHNADQAVSRLLKYLSPSLQIDIIWPWMQETRKFRVSTVLRTMTVLEDLDPYADYLVHQYRSLGTLDLLRQVARTPEAARLISPDELSGYFDAYIEEFKGGTDNPNIPARSMLRLSPDKLAKYSAMIAAKVLIVGGQTIPVGWLRTVPEVFSWAMDDISDRKHEDLLVFLIVENHESPELLWSAIRTARRLNLASALERGLEAARLLVGIPEHEIESQVKSIVQQRLPQSN